MTPVDFQTQLRLQLRQAALREERRSGVARQVARLPRVSPLVAVAAVALVALAVALGGLSLRGSGPDVREPAKSGVSRFTVSPTLGQIASGFGSVWAVNPNGRLLQLDPKTHEVLGALDVPPSTPIGIGAGSVWVGDQANAILFRIDPKRGDVVARIPLRTPAGDQFVAGGLTYGDRYAWAAGVDGLLRIDLRRNVADRLVAPETGGLIRSAVVHDGSLWVLARDDRLLRLDPRTGARRGSIRVSWQPTAQVDVDHGVPIEWSQLTGHIARVDLATGREQWTQELRGHINWWTVVGSDVWVHVSDGSTHDHVVRLDANTGRQLAKVQLPDLGTTAMAAVNGQLWVATPGGQIDVVKIAPR